MGLPRESREVGRQGSQHRLGDAGGQLVPVLLGGPAHGGGSDRPDVKAGPWTLQSSPEFLSDADAADMDAPRYLYAGKVGTALKGVEIKTCLVRTGYDDCITEQVAIPDHTSHATAEELDGALRLMEVDLPQFLRARSRADQTLGIYEWSQDGCSAPDVKNVNYFNRVFKDACIRHDFGYRNFGPGPNMGQWMDPRDSRRNYVDRQFDADMDWTCRTRPLSITRRRCLQVADVYYTAVRRLGGAPAFWQMH